MEELPEYGSDTHTGDCCFALEGSAWEPLGQILQSRECLNEVLPGDSERRCSLQHLADLMEVRLVAFWNLESISD